MKEIKKQKFKRCEIGFFKAEYLQYHPSNKQKTKTKNFYLGTAGSMGEI